MTPTQFDALADLLRLRGGASQECARLVLLEGLSVQAAADRTGLVLRAAYNAVQRVREAHEKLVLAYMPPTPCKNRAKNA